MKKLISFITILSVLMTSVVCFPLFAEAVSVPSAKLTDYCTNPDYDNIFTLESDINTDYVLLDRLSDGFLIMSDKVYDAQKFDEDAAQKFDPSDENNVAYYLNNEFFKTYIPEEMREYIAVRNWKTEGGNVSGICPNTYFANCRISLLSFEEYNNYYKKFGTVDHDNEIDWWLRTGDGNKKENVIAGGGVYTNWGKFVSADASLQCGLRPIFVLTDAFFENVKLNTFKMGKNVKKALLENISAQSMQKAGYSPERLRGIGYESINGPDEKVSITIPNEPYYMQDHEYSYFSVNISHSDTTARSYTIEYTSGENSKKIDVTVKPYKAYNGKISLNDQKKGIQNLDIKIMRDGELVGYDNARICLVDYYKRTPLDKYSRIGIGMPAWHSIETASGAGDAYDSFVKLSYRIAEIGFTKARNSPEWTWVESERGVYVLDEDRYKYAVAFRENGIEYVPFKINFGNQAVTKRETNNKMAAPNTCDAIQGFADYATNVKKLYDKIFYPKIAFNTYEVWNEPNLKNYWYPDVNYLEYSQMLNAVTYKIIRENPDAQVMAGSITSANQRDIFDAMYRNGMTMYSDQIAIHPYSYPNEPDERYVIRTPQYLEKLEEYGGWLEVAATEIGWPTWQSYNSATYDQQAAYMVKMLVLNDELGFIMTDVFSARNQGLQKTYIEHGFGIFEYNDRPKPSAASLSFFNNNVNDALYAGEFEISEGVRSFIYKRPGKSRPFAICWVTDDSKITQYTLKEKQYATDIFGNKLDGKTVTIGRTPIYIFELSDSYYMRMIAHDILGIYNELTEKLGDKFDFSAVGDLAKEASESNLSYSDTKKYIDKYFDLAEKLTEKALNDENLTHENSALIAHIMFKKGESMAASLENMELDSSAGVLHYEKTKNSAAAKKGDEPEASLLFTDAMLRYAYRYTSRIKEIKKMDDFDGKKERMGYYGYLSDKVCALADIMQKYETPNPSRVLFTYTQQTRQIMYKGKGYTIKAELENLRNKDFDGTAVLVDENGDAIGEEVAVKAKSGECVDVYVEGTAPKLRDAGTYIYNILYKEDGEVVKKQEIEVILKSLIDIDLMASETTLSNLNSVTVEVKNTFESAVKGKVKLTSPEGWVVESEKEINIPAGETQYIEFKVDSAKKVPFNEYCFNISVEDEEGSELAHCEKLLDFRIMVYDDKNYNPDTFDGDIAGWEDAYPIYVVSPENPGDINSWLGCDRSLKMLAKWNENNIYILADVYDVVHNNTYTGSNLWQGDSLQIAFDTFMNGLAPGTTKGYQSDDYEFGIGLTPNGIENYQYVASDSPIGNIEEHLSAVIRNDKLGITRYLIKIPNTYTKQLALKAGNKFGFNIAVNDSDVLLREGYSQYTSGICDSKNPSMFKAFSLVTNDSAQTGETDKIAFYEKVEEFRQGGN